MMKTQSSFGSNKTEHLTAFLLSLPRKYRSVLLFDSLSDKHLASHKSRLAT